MDAFCVALGEFVECSPNWLGGVRLSNPCLFKALLARCCLPKVDAKREPQTFFDKHRAGRFGSEQTSRVAPCREPSFPPARALFLTSRCFATFVCVLCFP